MALFGNKRRAGFEGGGLVLFREVADAMRGEAILKEAGYLVKLVAPPPELRKGCDLALEVPLVERLGVERALGERDVPYVSLVPLDAEAPQLSDIVEVKDFGETIMVKAANMKLTYAKATGVIVNTSGGGCPDIPFLHDRLVGKTLGEAPRPRDIGFTLCALLLERALEECLVLHQAEETVP